MDTVNRDAEWLWQGGAAPDSSADAIERALAARRLDPAAGDAARIWRAAAARRTRRRRLGISALAATVLAGACAWHLLGGAPAGDSTRTIGGSLAARDLPPELRVEAGAAGARIELGTLGWLDLDPGSAIARVALPGAEHGFYLERGGLEALVTAPPRMFQIGTPAGLSIDLGCRYRLDVDHLGAARLSVSLGHVAFEGAGRSVLVPAGASCAADRARGPSSPTWQATPDEWRAAVERLDRAGEPLRADLERLACADDTLALWHLLQADCAAVRKAALARLEALAPRPPDVDRAALIAGDSASARSWLTAFEWAQGAL